MDYKKCLEKINMFLGFILGLLGVCSCDKSKDPWNEVCYYGTPYAKYEVTGAVLNTEGESIQGIQITSQELYTDGNSIIHIEEMRDTAYTDSKGDYQLKGNRFFGQNKLRVIASDPSNTYTADTLEIDLLHSDKDKGGWVTGTEIGTADFTLKHK